MSLRIPAAAKRLSIDVKLLRAMAARGDVPAVKLGKVWIFDEMLLDEWLRERCRQNLRVPSMLVLPTAKIARVAHESLAVRLDRILAETCGDPNDGGSRRARDETSAAASIDASGAGFGARQAMESATASASLTDDGGGPAQCADTSTLSPATRDLIRLLARAAIRPKPVQSNTEPVGGELRRRRLRPSR